MLNRDYKAWDECPEVSECELIREFMKLVDTMIRDIQHLEAETVRARYALSEKLDPEHKWITGCDILSDLSTPYYDSIAYKEFISTYYDGEDPMEFKEFLDSMVHLAEGRDEGMY